MSLSSGVSYVALVLMLFATVGYTTGCTYYNGPPSDHYDGSRFHNTTPDHSFTDMLKWWWQMETVDWPDWVDDPLRPAPPAGVESGALRVTYINHATVLIQMDGTNILTDPFWSKRAGPFSWLGAKRVRVPGVRIRELPEIHVVIISHDHYDHLDFPTLKALVESHKPLVVAGLGLKKRLRSMTGIKVVELDWWQAYHDKEIGLDIVSVPSQHSSGRGLWDKNKTLWAGFVLRSPHGNVVFMGDTAFGDFFEEISSRYGPFRLALLPIGSYEKRWFMRHQHMNPDDAVRAHQILGARQSVGIHFGTLREHPEQTITAHETDLADALVDHGVSADRFRFLKFGEGLWVPNL